MLGRRCCGRVAAWAGLRTRVGVVIRLSSAGSDCAAFLATGRGGAFGTHWGGAAVDWAGIVVWSEQAARLFLDRIVQAFSNQLYQHVHKLRIRSYGFGSRLA